MNFSEKDLLQMDNLLKCIRQGKFDLSGDEALAFASMFTWAVNHRNLIKDSLQKKKDKMAIASSINPTSPNKDVAKSKKAKKGQE